MPAAEGNEDFFLDTNVLVYAWSAQDALKRDIARTLAEAEGARVSTQVLSELANVLIRRFRVAPAEVRHRLASIAGACEVVPVTTAVVLDALRIAEKFGYGFFDSQIVAAALACGATVLYSEDLHHGQLVDGVLEIRSPFGSRAAQARGRYRQTRSQRPGRAKQRR